MNTEVSFVFSNHCMIVPSPIKYHSHTVYEYVYYLEGRGCLNTAEGSYNYAPGSVIIFNPSETAITPAYFVISKLNQAWDRSSDADIAEIWSSYMQEYSGYSYDRFRHKFKKDMGMSPNQFLLQLRIHKACWLLKETTMNVTEIALACGFSSCSYFTQQFRKSTGIAPSHYRTRLRAGQSLFTEFQNRPDETQDDE